MGEVIVSYSSPQDEKTLADIGYPVIPLTDEDVSCQQELEKRYAPSSLSAYLGQVFPPGFQGFFLMSFFVWGTVFPFLWLMDAFFISASYPITGQFLLYGVPSLLSLFAFIAAVVMRFEFKSHKVTKAIQGLKYRPWPQSHTRGAAMLREVYNISSQILSSYAWKEGLACKTRDIRKEAISIINGIMEVYDGKNREVEGRDAELDALQERLDSIRHYARYEMTAM